MYEYCVVFLLIEVGMIKVDVCVVSVLWGFCIVRKLVFVCLGLCFLYGMEIMVEWFVWIGNCE